MVKYKANLDYNFDDILKVVSCYFKKYNDFNKIDSSAFEELSKEINDTNAYEEEVKKLVSVSENLIAFKHENYKKILDDMTKSFETELNENQSGDFSKLDENEVGYYNYKNEIVFYGKIKDGFYNEGILMRKEGEEEMNIYYGNFSLDGDNQIFEGIYLPAKQGVIIFGSIVKDTVNGIVLSLKEDKLDHIYKGKLVNNQKEGDNITISLTDNMLVSNCLENSYFFVPKKLLKHNDLTVFKNLKEAIYTRHENTHTLYYSNKNIYQGEIDEQYNRKGKGEYYIYNNDHIKIIGNFDNDNVDDAVVSNKDNFNIFKGKFRNNAMNDGTYYFSETERFEGTFENGLKKKGTYYYANGTKYEGEWSQDKKVGTGKYTNQEGEEKVINN